MFKRKTKIIGLLRKKLYFRLVNVCEYLFTICFYHKLREISSILAWFNQIRGSRFTLPEKD